MLLAYFDEAGIGDAKNEKYVVVAGVVVEDTQYKAVEKRILEVRDKHVPEKHRKGFIFHASDMFKGVEKRISREDFPVEKRRDALEDLISISAELKLPVIQGFYERELGRKKFPEMNEREAVTAAQAIASTMCLLTLESFTQRYAKENTLALMIYENNEQSKLGVKQHHLMFKDPETIVKVYGEFAHEQERLNRLIPLRRVIDTAHFAEKSEAPILQLADVCAYFIKRRLMGRMDSMRYLRHVMNQLTSNANSMWPMANEPELNEEKK